MKILVTGGLGFIGSHIVDALIERGHEIVVFDNLEPQVHPLGDVPSYAKGKVVLGDIRDSEVVKNLLLREKPEVVFHQAACVSVSQGQKDIKKYVDVNIGGTANLLDVLVNKYHDLKKFILAGSMSSYGEGKSWCPRCQKHVRRVRPDLRFAHLNGICGVCPDCKRGITPVATDESWPLGPQSIYACTKREQEELVSIAGKIAGCDTICLRYFNVYGERQTLSNVHTGIVPIFTNRLLNRQKPLIYEDGLQCRDFIHVDDVVQANMLVLESEGIDSDTFNVGTGKRTTILTVASQIAAALGNKPVFSITGEVRQGDIRHCYACTVKSEKLLGFKAKVELEDGIRRYVQYVQSSGRTA